MVVLAEFNEVRNGRRVLPRLIAGDLYLMIADRRRQLALALVVIDPHIYHSLYHAISPPMLTAYSKCVIVILYDSNFVISRRRMAKMSFISMIATILGTAYTVIGSYIIPLVLLVALVMSIVFFSKAIRYLDWKLDRLDDEGEDN